MLMSGQNAASMGIILISQLFNEHIKDYFITYAVANTATTCFADLPPLEWFSNAMLPIGSYPNACTFDAVL